MPNTGSALDRLGRLMHGEDIEEVDDSISSEDYMDDLEDDIMSKMHIEEVSLSEEEPSDDAETEDSSVIESTEVESQPVESVIEEVPEEVPEPIKEEPIKRSLIGVIQ